MPIFEHFDIAPQTGRIEFMVSFLQSSKKMKKFGTIFRAYLPKVMSKSVFLPYKILILENSVPKITTNNRKHQIFSKN